MARWPLVVLAFSFGLVGSPNQASAMFSGMWQYVSQYQLGIDYSTSWNNVQVDFKSDPALSSPSEYCGAPSSGSTLRDCSIVANSGGSSGFGLFLQRAFKKQGFWYFDYDLGIGFRYLQGERSREGSNFAGTPLRSVKFSLLSGIVKPYFQFGITPQGFPDILVSLGPILQTAVGQVSVNDKSRSVVLAQSNVNGLSSLWRGFVELELVLWRFGEGAFSLITSREFAGSGEGTKFYPESVDGMSDFKAKFNHGVGGAAFGMGLKLVTTVP